MFTGDFNSYLSVNPSNPELTTAEGIYSSIRDRGFLDLYLAAGNRDIPGKNTVHNFLGPHYQVPDPDTVHRIDWIWLQPHDHPFQIKSCTILEDADPPIYPSDHYPVLAEIDLGSDPKQLHSRFKK